MDSFAQIQTDIKLALNDDLLKEKLKVEDVMAILWILGQAKDEAELKVLVAMFAGEYPSLKSVLIKEQQSEKATLEADVQEIVVKMIKDNPLQASELAKFASRHDATMKALLEKFPEAKNYL